MNAFDLFPRIYDLPPALQYRLLNAGIPRVLPIASGLGIRVRELSDQRAVTTMPLSRKSRNHVGSMYLGATLVAAEVTMALFAIRALRPPEFRVLVAGLDADFTAQGRGTVRAVCEPDEEQLAHVERARAMAPGKEAFGLSARVESVDDGRLIATVGFRVSVKRLG